MHGLYVLRRRNRFIGISLFNLADIPGEDFEGSHEKTGKQHRRKKDNDQHDQHDDECLPAQNILGL